MTECQKQLRVKELCPGENGGKGEGGKVGGESNTQWIGYLARATLFGDFLVRYLDPAERGCDGSWKRVLGRFDR